jgi:predicted dehydrogenase
MTIEASKGEGQGRQIRLGMVGGGQGAFIGAVHRIAARMDDNYTLVAGALSGDPARAKASGAELGLDAARAYDSYQAMAAAEGRRTDGIEAVAIVTPNHLHQAIAREFLNAGIHVICDKPLAVSLEEARSLQDLARKTGLIFAVTYNYSGYPMVRQAEAMVAAGELGDIRVVQVEYPQGWLATPIEESGQKQAAWRTDPAQSGAGGAIGDIGTHAFQLAEFVSRLEVSELIADLTTFVAGRRLDDNAQLLLRFGNGARGMLWASQVAVGCENGLKLRVYGTKGGLEWAQENPNLLWFAPHGEAQRLITRGGAGAGPAAARVTRTPFGHPEGYLEAFGNIYAEVARAIRAAREGGKPDPDSRFPTVDDGARGVAFIAAAVESSKAGGKWVRIGSRQ